jgi:DNA helicase HerA-like ATPase
MTDSHQLVVGATAAGERVLLDAGMANRHGLVAGATGTGKTVTLQMLAESFSRLGVPVFTADVKGDLSGIARAGQENPKIAERVALMKLDDHAFEGAPVVFWDVFGQKGHPVRTTVSEMGPVLLANLLELNETQEGILHIAFKVADDEGLLLLDLKDLRAMLTWLADNAKEIGRKYGNVAGQSVASIQRRLLVLEQAGGETFFGEPALDIADLMRSDRQGRGYVSVLDATTLYHSPRIYATFLLWLLAELMEKLPERGDAPLPKLVFFFDEAHLLFEGAPKALVDKITQVVRLIRSKGVGVYFVSQYPDDVPDEVLGQLGNRVQHALRAYTPRDRKAVQVAATTFRENPAIDTATVISELGVGEALVSTLDRKGVPSVVQRVLVAPPRSRIGPLTDAERAEIIAQSPVKGDYEEASDRESAYELLEQRANSQKENAEAAKREAEEESGGSIFGSIFGGGGEAKPKSGGRSRQSIGEAMAKSAARSVGSSIGSSIGRQIVRGILGSLLGGKR